MNRQFFIHSYSSRRKRKKKLFRLRYLLLALVIYGGWHFFFSGESDDVSREGGKTVAEMESPAGPEPSAANAALFRAGVRPLAKSDLVHIDENLIRARNLTIDWDLQQFLAEMGARYKLYYGSLAVIDAGTGAILALYGQTPTGQDCSLGLDTEPAASIFKVVTATAAMDQAGFTDQSVFFYTGNAHTLYKSQLSNKRNRWCDDISLAEAFARSNNVVFGKLGTIYLGQAPIFLTAKRLGFWKSPLKEFTSEQSTSFLPRDEYNLAELACGFNKQTRMSPLHAAQILTPVLNRGAMVTPRIVASSPVEKVQAMRVETASRLGSMMQMTVRSGTVAKTFRGVGSDRVMKHLDIGGKSGSIDGDDPAGRRSWFAGYAVNRDTGQGIAVGCCLILKDHFLIEAHTLTRLVMRHYFSNQPTGGPAVGALPARSSPSARSRGQRRT